MLDDWTGSLNASTPYERDPFTIKLALFHEGYNFFYSKHVSDETSSIVSTTEQNPLVGVI